MFCYSFDSLSIIGYLHKLLNAVYAFCRNPSFVLLSSYCQALAFKAAKNWLAIISIITATFFLDYIFKKKSRITIFLINLSLLLSTLTLTEYYLSTQNNQKILGSVKYLADDKAINAEKIKNSNRWGFDDKHREYKKSRQTAFRIAILGDSYVWGSGLERKDSFSHILAAQLEKLYGNKIEVLTWGRHGWSTQDELDFLTGEGSKFQIDYLIIGFVKNDPEVRGLAKPRRYLRIKNNLFKNTAYLINRGIESITYEMYWRDLYSGGNWQEYKKVVAQLKDHLQKIKIPCLFITLPTMERYNRVSYQGKLKDLGYYYGMLFKVLDENGIDYLDLYPKANARFGSYTPQQIRKELWANPANGHPSRILHQFYAEELLDYLTSKRIVPSP